MSSDDLPPPTIEPPAAEVIAEAASKSALEYSPPRLSIAMLLVWTAVIAVNFTAERWLGLITLEASEVAVGLSFLLAACNGTGAATLLLLGLERSRHRQFPGQPGEWILVALGGGHTLNLLWLFICWRFEFGHWADFRTIYTISLCNQIIYALPYLIAWRRGGGGVNWYAVYTMLALYALWPTVFYSAGIVNEDLAGNILMSKPYGFVASARPYLLGTVLFGALLIDYFREMQRGWLHYVGVATLFTELVAQHIYEIFLWGR